MSQNPTEIFRTGDRVLMVNPRSAVNGWKGTIVGGPVLFDGNNFCWVVDFGPDAPRPGYNSYTHVRNLPEAFIRGRHWILGSHVLQRLEDKAPVTITPVLREDPIV